MRLLMTALFIALASPAIASPLVSKEEILEFCEKAIADRQFIPEAFRSVSAVVSVHIRSREEVMSKLVINIQKNMERFDSGEWSPRDVMAIVTYEATNEDSELVTKRSVCKFEMRNEADFPPDNIFIDRPPKRP